MERKSQIVIPVNPQTLFTTLLGAAIIASVTFILVTIPGKITEIRDAQVRIEQQQSTLSDLAKTLADNVNQNKADIVEMKTTRFTDHDGAALVKSVIAEMQTTLAPWFSDVATLKKDVDRANRRLDGIEGEMRDLNAKLNNGGRK